MCSQQEGRCELGLHKRIAIHNLIVLNEHYGSTKGHRQPTAWSAAGGIFLTCSLHVTTDSDARVEPTKERLSAIFGYRRACASYMVVT